MTQSFLDFKIPKIPTITPELVEYLEFIFPDVAGSYTDSTEDLWRRVGRAEVTRAVRDLYNLQQTEEPDLDVRTKSQEGRSAPAA